MCVLPDGRLHSIVRSSYRALLNAAVNNPDSLSEDNYIEDLRTMTEYARQLINGSHPAVNTKCIFVRVVNTYTYPKS